MKREIFVRTPGLAKLANARPLMEHIRNWIVFMGWLIMMPFRLIGTVTNIAAAVGRGLLRWTIQLCFGLIGIAFIGMVGFGLIRVIFHPLFL